MKILYYIPYPNGLGADHWIYQGWKNAFIDLGHEFSEVYEQDDWEARIIETNPDIFFIANSIQIASRRNALAQARELGIKVFMIVDWPQPPGNIDLIRELEIADVYFGEREPQSMEEFRRLTRKEYHLVPNAADKTMHFPTDPVNKYKYDIVYLGAYLPKKKRMFNEVLIPLTRKYKVGLFGPGRTLKDNILRAGQRFCRRVGFINGADALNRRRISVPPEEENQLYSSAKICLNFHEREADGTQPHYILNQRTFKIPACGGFEICDYVPALRKYFAEDEVVMADSPEDWANKVDYFLNNDLERERIQARASQRAHRDHTYHNRVEQVLQIYDSI